MELNNNFEIVGMFIIIFFLHLGLSEIQASEMSWFVLVVAIPREHERSRKSRPPFVVLSGVLLVWTHPLNPAKLPFMRTSAATAFFCFKFAFPGGKVPGKQSDT